MGMYLINVHLTGVHLDARRRQVCTWMPGVHLDPRRMLRYQV
jgi:hypothetical protein